MHQTILVTGGTGYIGSWVVKGLLEKGHNVRITVRNKNKTGNYDYLVKLAENTQGKLEIWEADLLQAGCYDEVAKGCDAVAHIASPFILNVKDPKRELLDPAFRGTINVLEAANRSGTVKKVVLTSSVAAIYGDCIDMKDQGISAFTEEHFNSTSSLDHQPYQYSKVMAEKKAWEMAQNASWQMAVINPAFVLGPTLGSESRSESLKVINDLLSGKFIAGIAELHLGFVDVRDVATAHIYALENGAEGRHILSERVTDMLSLSNIIRDLYGKKFKLPRFNIPKWLVMNVGGMFGITRKFVKYNIGIPIAFDTTKSKEKLKLKYTPLEKTIKDMVDQRLSAN
jgi:nucleoside-diphosphate-sugar epimerase